MLKFNELKVGNVLSESSFSVIKEIRNDCAIVTDLNGIDVKLSKDYLEKLISCAEQFDKEEKINQTNMINIILTNPRTAMSIQFVKQNKKKTKKVIEEETLQWAQDVKNAFLAKGESGIEEYAQKTILPFIPGELRIIKGHHFGTQDERGRIQFKDMEDDEDILKAVDPRTISFVIVNNVKYNLK